MERGQLKAWLDQGLSLEQIGALIDRNPSTVGYWCKKYGFTPNGRTKYAARGGLTRGELAPLVEAGMTYKAIAAAVNRSVPTVRYWLTRYGLESVRQFRRQQIEDALRRGENTLRRRCRRHGLTEYALVGSEKRPRCKKCRSEAVARKRRRNKERLVNDRGGKCMLCGYDRCLAALQLHHVDPETKEFGIAHRGFTRSFADVRAEAEKCVLLCSNCHAEVEAGVASLPDDPGSPG